MHDPALMARTAKLATDWLESLPERPVGERLTLDELRERLGHPLPDEGLDPREVIDQLVSDSEGGHVATGSPRYFGFVIGGSLAAALAADWLVSSWDQNGGGYAPAPATTVMEDVASRWVLDLLDLPAEASVGFVTGCQMAHFTCMAAARRALLLREGWDVDERGLFGAPEVHVIAGAQAHATIFVALRMLGFGQGRVRLVETDDQGRMLVDDLERALGESEGPTLVSAQAGEVNTGAFDPFDEITALCREHGAWCHVDGAFGLWAAASPALRHLVEGVERADSWATDGHKWLNVPYDCGIAIVRDRDAHRGAMSSTAVYIPRDDDVPYQYDWTPEFSRRARGVPVYAALRSLGRRGVAEMVERCCECAALMGRLLGAEDGIEVLNDVVLNQVLVRFGGDDAVTDAVLARVQQEGTCWMSGTTWRGEKAMRISVSNWATTAADIERSAAAIVAALRAETAAEAHA